MEQSNQASNFHPLLTQIDEVGRKRAKKMLQLEEKEEEEGMRVMMGKVTNYESEMMMMEGSKMFTKAKSVNHQYSEEERKLLNSYNSMDYLPPHSKV